MKPHDSFLIHTLTALAVVTSLAVAAPALSQPSTNDRSAVAEDTAARQSRMREHVQARLDRMAKRLNIDASQQDAWNAYAKTVEGMIGTGLQRSAADADAATVVRFRAQVAAAHAQKLEQLADATAALQQALKPEQRKVLDQIVRHPGHGRFGHQDHVRG